MTVPSEQSRIQYTTDGTSVSFPVPFRFLNAAHLQVARQHNDESSILELGVDYSVSGVGNQAGGTITTTTTLPAGDSISIERVVPITQETAYQRNDPFPERAHEQALDKLTMICQMLGGVLGLTPGSINRALLLGAADTDGKGSYRANGNRISNLGAPKSTTDAARLQDIIDRLSDLATDGSGQFVVERLADTDDPSNGLGMIGYSGNENARSALNRAFSEIEASEKQMLDRTGEGDSLALLGSHCAAKMPVRIAIYGDSTVDGTNTTGWTANATAGGNAIENHNHNLEAPNSWPVRLQVLARDITGNPNINVYNAGYGGKAITTGWFAANYAKAIDQNAHYADATHVVISAGLNDIASSSFSPVIFKEKLFELVEMIRQSGRVPVLTTLDFPSFSLNRGAKVLAGVAENVIRDVASLRGIEVVDTGAWLVKWQNERVDNDRWAYHQNDGLHWGNLGHWQKAAYMARHMLAGLIVDVSDNSRVAPWQGDLNTTQGGLSVFRQVNNHFSACLNAASFSAGSTAVSVFLWSDKTMFGHYASVDRDVGAASSSREECSKINVVDAFTGSVREVPVFFGDHANTSTNRSSELILGLGTIRAGITRIDYKPKAGSTSSLGYFLFRDINYSNSIVGVVRLTATTGQSMSAPDFYAAPVNYANTLGSAVRNIAIKSTPVGWGALFSSSRVFDNAGDTTLENRAVGVMLYRSGNDAQLRSVTYNSDGPMSFSEALFTTTGGAKAGRWGDTANGILSIGINSAGQQVIQLYIENVLAAEYTVPKGNPPLPLNGVVGGAFRDSNTAQTTLTYVEITVLT